MLTNIVNSFMSPFLKMLPLIILVLIGGVAIMLLSLFLKRKSKGKNIDMPYEKKETLLSPAENSFYQVLRQILGVKFHIYPKVRLCDIVKVKPGTKPRQAAFNRIQSKHIDFLICDQQSKPVRVIELDESPHNTAKAREKDRFKDELFETVGLRCVRVKASSSYNTEELKAMLMPPKIESKA